MEKAANSKSAEAFNNINPFYKIPHIKNITYY